MRLARSGVVDHLHSKGLGNSRDTIANRAQADDTHALALQLPERTPHVGKETTVAVGATLDALIEVGEFTHEIQQMGKGALHDTLGRVAGYVLDGDTQLLGCCQIDVVHARCSDADHL